MCLALIFFIFPPEILRIIQLDLDLKYKTNIRELFEEFDSFLPGAVIGIAREMQPVYRYVAAVRARAAPPRLPCPAAHGKAGFIGRRSSLKPVGERTHLYLLQTVVRAGGPRSREAASSSWGNL